MIFEPYIEIREDGATCQQPGGGYHWQIRRTGPLREINALFDAATTREVIDREALLQFAYHRGPVNVLGVVLSAKTLQSFVEHLQGGELDARVIKDGLAVRQGKVGLGVIAAVTFSPADVPETFDIKHPNGQETVCRRWLDEAENGDDFTEWAAACVDGPGKVPEPIDFTRASSLSVFNPVHGAPVASRFFDAEGAGPNIVEIMIDGLDAIGKDGTRIIDRAVRLSLPDTILKGGCCLDLRSLTALSENVQAALAWMLDGMAVKGCTCGWCHVSKPETRCESARKAGAAGIIDGSALLDEVNETVDRLLRKESTYIREAGEKERRIAELEAFLGELFEGCEYGDDCPPFVATNHHKCRACQIRRLLAGKPDGAS